MGHAIPSNPKLLLLDKPTEGIQPSIVDRIEDVIIGFKNSRRFAILPGLAIKLVARSAPRLTEIAQACGAAIRSRLWGLPPAALRRY